MTAALSAAAVEAARQVDLRAVCRELERLGPVLGELLRVMEAVHRSVEVDAEKPAGPGEVR